MAYASRLAGLAVAAALVLVPDLLRAQSASADLAGTVLDQTGTPVPGAEVALVNRSTGAGRRATTDEDGAFAFPLLPPSRYELEVRRSGFTPVRVSDLVLRVGERRALRLALSVRPLEEAVVVEAAAGREEGAAVSTAIGRPLLDRQPLNGRSFQTLLELAPGVVIAPSNVTAAGTFSVNGQRAGSNAFVIDGVSANFATTAAATLYQSAGGGLPSFSALGTTNTLASVDTVQEFQVQTSTYAPEFGRQAGAQVAIVTRSGTNDWRGSAFYCFRDDALDANDFFVNAAEQPSPELTQHAYGATLGGPLRKDRLFLFASYEGLRLRQPVVPSPVLVPSLEARGQGSQAARDILNAFPLPNRPPLADDPLAATFVGAFSVPSRLDSISVRADFAASARLSLFARYAYGPSRIEERAYFATPNTTSFREYASESLTFGATSVHSSTVTNDLRVNLSRSRAGDRYELDAFGGAVVPPGSTLLPPFADPSSALGIIYIGPSGLNLGLNSLNRQRQIQVVDTLTAVLGRHTLRVGVDYRRLAPRNGEQTYLRFYSFDTVADVLSETVPFFYAGSVDEILEPRYWNLGLFAQDTWRASSRLTLTYGVRYDVNPAPGEKAGRILPTTTTAEPPFTLAPQGTRYFRTSRSDLAPRLGASFDADGRGSLVLRGGVGVFYDLPYTFTGSAFYPGAYPYGTTLVDFGVALDDPRTTTPLAPAVLAPPNGDLVAYEPGYRTPYTVQWSAGADKRLGAAFVASASYVGAAGRRLGRVESLRGADPDFPRVDVVRNAASSSYHGLHLQLRRQAARGLNLLASYTLGRARDNVSDETIVSFQAPAGSYDPELDRGPADFDLRHVFSGAVSYDVSPVEGSRLRRAIFGGWGVDLFVRARSAPPVNVTTGEDPLGLGYSTVARPDLVPGQPLYLDDPAAPGGRRLNPDAFVAPDEGRQGSLGRNALRGFPAAQVDVSVRRAIRLSARVEANLRLDAFNLFNRPNFAPPEANLDNPGFGSSTRTLAQGLGGVSALYQIGGPRSLQLSARLVF